MGLALIADAEVAVNGVVAKSPVLPVAPSRYSLDSPKLGEALVVPPPTRSVTTMSITPKQLAANQQNALASTGPRTITGKSNSSRNSLKHGIFARHTVVSRLESTEEFDALLEDLSTDLAPSGVLEEILAGEIAALHWRLRRVLRAEAGASGAAIHDALTQPAQE